MENFFRRIKTKDIYPPFLEKCEYMIQELSAQGKHFYAISGYRSKKEQADLYAQGRTKPGPKVTNVTNSAHMYGIAIDFCADADITRAGLQPDWNAKSYEPLVAAAQDLDLEAGGAWTKFKDWPHIQLPLAKHKVTLAKLREIENKGGMKAVFEFLDTFDW